MRPRCLPKLCSCRHTGRCRRDVSEGLVATVWKLNNIASSSGQVRSPTAKGLPTNSVANNALPSRENIEEWQTCHVPSLKYESICVSLQDIEFPFNTEHFCAAKMKLSSMIFLLVAPLAAAYVPVPRPLIPSGVITATTQVSPTASFTRSLWARGALGAKLDGGRLHPVPSECDRMGQGPKRELRKPREDAQPMVQGFPKYVMAKSQPRASSHLLVKT